MTIQPLPNEFLAALHFAEFALLRGHLRRVELSLDDVLARAGAPLRRVYFPHGGIISSMACIGPSEIIEVAMIGREGVFGGSAALYGAVSSTTAIVRYPGSASVIDVGQFRTVAEQSAPLRAALMRRQWTDLVQAEQTVACHAAHGLEARLCSRLLRSRDLARSNSLPLTQVGMAQMLAVQRNTISLAAHALQQAGVIRFSRGHLEIIDLEGLIARACECYVAERQCAEIAGVALRIIDRGPRMPMPAAAMGSAPTQRKPS